MSLLNPIWLFKSYCLGKEGENETIESHNKNIVYFLRDADNALTALFMVGINYQTPNPIYSNLLLIILVLQNIL